MTTGIAVLQVYILYCDDDVISHRSLQPPYTVRVRRVSVRVPRTGYITMRVT